MKKLLTIMCAAMTALGMMSAFGLDILGEDAVSGYSEMVHSGQFVTYVFTNTAADASITIGAATKVNLLVVGGGGSGGNVIGGGGAGGEVICEEEYELSPGTYTIKVGAGGLLSGGAGSYHRTYGGVKGGDTTFGPLTAVGGGGGRSYSAAGEGVGGGKNGSSGADISIGGKGAGADAVDGNGGKGVTCSWSEWMPDNVYGAGGGSGDGDGSPWGVGGSEFAGDGGQTNSGTGNPQGGHGVNGTGSGGGGGGWWSDESTQGGGDGGSGIVIVMAMGMNLEDAEADIVAMPVDGIKARSVDLNWNLYSTGGGDTATILFEYGFESGDYTGSVVLDEAAEIGSATYTLAGLQRGVDYYGRFVARGNGDGAEAGYSGEFSFSPYSMAEVESVSGNYVKNEYDDIYTSYVFTDTSAKAKMTFAQRGKVDIMVIAGGGAGGTTIAGGGGAGEVKILNGYLVEPNVEYEITVGAGGKGMGTWDEWYYYPGRNGENSSFGDIVTIGGGGGGSWAWGTEYLYCFVGQNGGSGGGSARGDYSNGYHGWEQGGKSLASDGGLGYPGGASGYPYFGNRIPGGGGGAGGPGEDGKEGAIGGNGGPGITNNFATGEWQWYAGGGGAGGGEGHASSGQGGSGIGGNGGTGNTPYGCGYPGVDGTGSGGGGSHFYADGNRGSEFGGNGGSGVVVVRLTVDTEDNYADIKSVSVSDIGAHDATFNWRLISTGIGDQAVVQLEYGTESGLYSSTVTLDDEAMAGDGSLAIDGLSEATTYYARYTALGNGDGDTVGYSREFTFTTEQVTDPIGIDVGTVLRYPTRYSAVLDFGEELDGAMLVIASGETLDDPTGWTTTDLPSIDDGETGRVVQFTVADTDRYFRFIAEKEGEKYYSKIVGVGDGLAVSDNDPVINSHFTLDGMAGDGISVSGLLDSAGAGDTAAVYVEYAITASLADSHKVFVGNLGASEAINATLHVDDPEAAEYIRPNTTYFVRIEAVGEGGYHTYSSIKSVTTLASFALGGITLTSEETAIHAVADITAVGASGMGTAKLLVGSSADTLVEVLSKDITGIGEVVFDYTNSTFGTVYAKVVVENSCETVDFSASSELGSASLADYSIWYWVGPEGGLWSDPDNWENSWGTPGVNVGNCPNSGNVPICFDRAEQPISVSVDGDYYVSRVIPGGISNHVEFVGVNRDSSKIHICADLGYSLGYDENAVSVGSVQTYRDLSLLYDGTNPQLIEGGGICLYNCYLTAGHFFMHRNNTLFEMHDESYASITYQFMQMYGSGARVVIDNSTFSVNNYWNDASFNISGNTRIDFMGDHPQIIVTHNIGFIGANAKVVFHVPDGGFKTAPFYCAGCPYGPQLYYNAGCVPTFEIAEDSGLFTGKKCSFYLIDWSNGNGYASEGWGGFSDGITLVTPHRTVAFRSLYQDKTETPATGKVPGTENPWPGEDGVEPLHKYLEAVYAPSGMAVFVR